MNKGDLAAWWHSINPPGSLIVRAVGIIDNIWSDYYFGSCQVLVEVIYDEVVTTRDTRAIDNAITITKSNIKDILSNITIGGYTDKSFIISLDHTEEVPNSRLSILKSKWKDEGRCHKCGDNGTWINLALTCKYHGIF